jgi:hypothetical protein
MKNLLYKEFRLAVPKTVFIFPLLCVLLLIPNWPYFLAMGYVFLAYIFIFAESKANQDIPFTVSLPIQKRDTVRARFYTVAAIELLQIILAIPFAIVRSMINHKSNMGGMDANIAFFGFVFVMFAIFNAVFLPMFYKTGYKFTTPWLLAIGAATVYASGIELAVHFVPFLKINFDTPGANHLISQLTLLIAGIGIFALITALACQKAAKNFEKVDL